MKTVKLDAREEAVKQFVLELTDDHGESVLELNGRAVAVVVPTPKTVACESPSAEWCERKNARRCELIDREIDGILAPEEVVELRQLQDEMLRYQNQIVPWPIQPARQLHKTLLQKAAKTQDGSDA